MVEFDQGNSSVGEGRKSSVIIVSDQGPGARLAEFSVQVTGARLAAAIGFSEAIDRLQNQVSLDAILIECGDRAPEEVHPILEERAAIGGTRPPHAVVVPRLEDLDCYARYLGDDSVTLVCNGDVADRVVALQAALSTPSNLLHDSAADLEPMRLKRIADEVGRIAKALANLSDTDFDRPASGVSDVMIGFRAEPKSFAPVLEQQDGPSSSTIRSVIRARRMRDQFFEADLFADPSWDMMLDLWAARREGAKVSVSSLCIASAVPPTTALRWIKRLTDDAIVERVEDPDDGRRIFVRLSDAGAQAMSRYWEAASKTGGFPI